MTSAEVVRKRGCVFGPLAHDIAHRRPLPTTGSQLPALDSPKALAAALTLVFVVLMVFVLALLIAQSTSQSAEQLRSRPCG